MKILILEDRKERIDFFREKLHAHEVSFFEHVTDAISFISNNYVDIIFLDHDLEQLHDVPSDNFNTGYEFAKYIVDNKLAENSTIIIHSMNPVGADAIYKVLKHHEDRLAKCYKCNKNFKIEWL